MFWFCRVKRSVTARLCVLLLWSSGLAFATSSEIEPQTGLPTQRVVIETQTGARHIFKAELAATEHTRIFGLMHRKHMNIDEGMLFDFQVAKKLTFWMKNTYISLDMLFINAKGEIIHIARQTLPLSLAPISSEGAARWVFEINGGLSDILGIASGDRIHIEPPLSAL